MKTLISLVSLALLATGSMPASAALIAYFPFEADFNDASGSNNHATGRGTAGAITINTASPAAVGSGSVAFDNGVTGGGGNVLSVNNTTGGLNLSGMPVFTLSIWLLSTANQTDRRIFAEASSTSTNPLYTLGTGTIRATVPTSSNEQFNFYRRTSGGAVTNNHEVSPESPFETGTWQNAVWIDQSGAVDLYLNGTYSRSNTYTDSDLAVNTTSFGGVLRAAGLAGFTGQLDDIGIWNEAPTNPAAFARAIASGMAANTVAITIPEPATGALSLLAIAGLAMRRRR